MNTTLFVTNINPEYRFIKRFDKPCENPGLIFVNAFDEALRGRNVTRLWGEKYNREMSDTRDSFVMRAFKYIYGQFLINEISAKTTKDGVEIWVNGEKDFEITNRQLNELDKINFNILESSGTLKSILEKIGEYIDNFTKTRKEVYEG